MTDPPLDDQFLAFQTAVIGRYSLERELGRGGMGIVYLAREVRLDRLVALKLFPPALAALPALRERFLREARMAARLSHPHVVQIYTVDEVDRYVFFAMAYVDGETLGARVRARGPLPPSEGARVLRELAWALGHAHEQGVIHRDVKPDNILLEAATGRALVADFGIAGLKHDTTSQHPDAVAGTPEFMSPEQASGGAGDARSDLYSLGVVGFYALSGQVPFSGTTSAEILAKHITQPPPPLSEQAPAVPRRVARIVDACLAKDPSERPDSAAQLAEQLALTLEHRKELPVALRAFVKHDARLDGPIVLLWPPLALMSAIAAGTVGGIGVGFGVLIVGLALAPAGALLIRARRLLKAGFEHTDLAPAFKVEIERGREERAFSVGPRATPLERMLRAGGIIGIGGSTIGVILASFFPELFTNGAYIAVFSTLAAIGWPSLVGHLALLQRRRDIDMEFWGGLWNGRVGRWLFRLARAVLPKRAIRAAMTHRPTELAIAMAAEQLFADLPKATRRQLGDLPTVLHRLEADAQRMRARLEDLLEAGVDPRLSAERDAVQQRLADTVAALETVRLGLLRLRSGGGTLQSMTTDLAAAREVGEAVDRLLAGQREVEEELKK